MDLAKELNLADWKVCLKAEELDDVLAGLLEEIKVYSMVALMVVLWVGNLVEATAASMTAVMVEMMDVEWE